jgi:Na+/proline symporter
MTLTLATHGTDHYLVQRLLVARSRRDAAVGLAASGFAVFAQFVIFLLLGTLLWAHYGGRTFARADEVLPHFVATEVGGAWAGLVLAAVIAAALSPSLNSMASATVRDFYVPFVRPDAGDGEQVRVARGATALWGVMQIAVALLAQGLQSSLDAGLAVLAHASGPTVGAFLLAVARPRTPPAAVLAGMGAGVAASLVLVRTAGLAWSWTVPTGAAACLAVAVVVSLVLPARAAPDGGES